jgi:hypothetical protein
MTLINHIVGLRNRRMRLKPDTGERIISYTRSIARAMADGSGHARPMPTLSAMLASTASATGAYAAWLASTDALAMSQRILAEAGRPIDPAEPEPA